MNASTGFKTKESALKAIEALSDGPDGVELVVLSEAARAKAGVEVLLNQKAKELAAEIINSFPESVEVVNANIVTSAGNTVMLSVRITKH
jgi:hypothetical protein